MAATGLKALWQRRFFNWVDRRAPVAASHALTRKNLYTFPNRQGLLYLVLILTVWIMGTNYQNNLILALCYLLASLFVVSILHAYANLAGMQIRFVQAEPAFAGDKVGFTVELITDNPRGAESVQLRWDNGDLETLSLNPNEATRTTLWLPSQRRGYLVPQRMLIQSCFPLGIIRCWTWVRLDARALVYPQPRPIDEPRITVAAGNQESGNQQQQRGDEFSGLRSYVAGDPIKHIAWKQYAQDRGLFTKQYQQLLSADKWLDWDALTLPLEERISGLCFWALDYEQRQIPYGLRLPGVILEPASGAAHLGAVLTALALFGE